MELLPFAPNWRTPPLERLDWLTDVLEAHDATEFRTPLRLRPRRTLEFELSLYGPAAARLDALLWQSPSQSFLSPVWTETQYLASALSAGATSIPATTEGYPDFEDGGQALLWLDSETTEIAAIDTVGASTLTLSAPLAGDWPLRTRLYPVREARVPDPVRLQYHTDRLAQGVMRLEMDMPAVSAGPGAVSYRSMEVFERPLNWVEGQTVEHERKQERMDYQTGAVTVVDESELDRLVRRYRTLLTSRADIVAWRGWIHERQGRFKPFWQPQWVLDLQQTASMTAVTTLLRVKSLDYAARYAYDPGRQDIALRHRSTNTWHYRRVTGVASAGDDEILTLDSALGFSSEPGDFDPITWLMPSRLDSDAVEISWYTENLAQSVLDIRSLRL